MTDSKFVEEEIDSEQVFDGNLLKVYRDRVRLPNGGESMREYVRHPGAVVILAELDDGNLLFERQYRYPLRRVMLELPAGKIDPEEDILECAKRELQEETGYEAQEWSYVGVMHPCVGYANERIEIFLARRLAHVGSALDEGEFLETIDMSLNEALAAVADGRISDGKTLGALLWAHAILKLGLGG